MKVSKLIALGALATGVTAPACLSVLPAHAATPNCGGQSAAPQPVPYTCNLPGIDITSQGVTRHFAAQVVANGTNVVVTYLMTGGVLPVDVPIRIVHHQGISGAGGTEDTAQGVIPAGKTTATLTDSAPCRDGQLDVKAVFVANGDSNGRVGGPWIQNGTGCTVVTTVPQSSTTTLPTSSTVPSSVVTTTIPGATTSVESTVATGSGGGALPPTGSSAGPVWVGLGLLFGGLFLLTAAVRRRAS